MTKQEFEELEQATRESTLLDEMREIEDDPSYSEWLDWLEKLE